MKVVGRGKLLTAFARDVAGSQWEGGFLQVSDVNALEQSGSPRSS